ncbi:MAG: four helix bundle protein [Verrucomicrobia bacterium]|nr:MAG: four helix bundle protein [Verrucomicrobiota bacterium]
MNADELKARTKEFAVRIVKLVSALPKTIEGRAIANQIVRSGTSVAANYRSACRAHSRSKFIAITLVGTNRCSQDAVGRSRRSAP